MPNLGNDRRLIEAAFPCNQIGAETQRERGASSSLPPLYFLHVWWARRPLTPSRAAVLGALLPHDIDPQEFLMDLGIQKKVALVGNEKWVLTGELLEKIQHTENGMVLPVDKKVLTLFGKEQKRRTQCRETIQKLEDASADFADNPVVIRWKKECQPLSSIDAEVELCVKSVVADPAHVNERIAFAESPKVKNILGSTYKWDSEDTYGYSRAYMNNPGNVLKGKTVLDLTSGGGSIPFEALRCGANVIANELNPVATVILNATLDYPFRYGKSLLADIEKWGTKFKNSVESLMAPYFPMSPLPENERVKIRESCGNNTAALEMVRESEVDQNGLLYCRTVTCPHCGKKVPLMTSGWLSKKAKDAAGVEVIPEGDGYRVRVYPVVNGKGPQGQDPDKGTVSKGVGMCIHCHQAIESEEIKSQARGESPRGEWKDELYIVAAVRDEATVLKSGKVSIKPKLFFRPANDTDRAALDAAKAALDANWDRWDRMGLIPTEEFPEGNDMRPKIYGMPRWCDMFTPRQLLGLLTLEEELLKLKPQIIEELGRERGKAVITYLQFAIDKLVDYNSRQTRWESTRNVVKGTFSRHDFALKWTYGELILSGKSSGIAWGLSQILDAYSEIVELSGFSDGKSDIPIRIVNGSAENIHGVESKSVDAIVFDPPYYNNVEYAELSDHFYVWDKRGLRDLYPASFTSKYTNKDDEAVANPVRDGGVKEADRKYEEMMNRIFNEAKRIVKDKGIMVMMFTHKKAEAWETLTKALIEAGWSITSTFPVESESSIGMNIKDTASAETSVFITCRKRTDTEPGTWVGFGGKGVKRRIRDAVLTGLRELEPLKLNAVDQVTAAYGRALQEMSVQWPVLDGDRAVSPKEAMEEASQVVAATQIERLSRGRIRVSDLHPEAALVVTLLGSMGTKDLNYDRVSTLARPMGVALKQLSGGYENGDFAALAAKKDLDSGNAVFAPLVLDKKKVSLLLPEQRAERRLKEKPQTEWDLLQGLILSYREGDIPVALSYLERFCGTNAPVVEALLDLWKTYAPTQELQKEAERLIYDLGQSRM